MNKRKRKPWIMEETMDKHIRQETEIKIGDMDKELIKRARKYKGEYLDSNCNAELG